jgi:hypothetical protein
VLEQDIADRDWAAQLGPVLSQRDVARLLGRTEQAVSKDRRLLRLVNRDGRPVYPVVQFDGRRARSRSSAIRGAEAMTTPSGPEWSASARSA